MIQQQDSHCPVGNTSVCASSSLKRPNEDETTKKPRKNSACAESSTSVLRNLFENPILSDVEIEGSDGTRIPAHRNILASRSEYFLQLFAGDFSEANASVVSLGFNGPVLKAVLEFCYTDQVNITFDEVGDEVCQESTIRFAVDLASAGDYFQLPKLCNEVFSWAMARMKRNPSLAWSFLVEAESSSQADVWSARACQIMTWYPTVCLTLNNEMLVSISLWALEQVVSDDCIPVEEAKLFNLIVSWASVAD